ncbi:NUDIX domain-containing protein [Paenibacillus filicis]|uniref:NUDIX domain-containing protein n=1 Tax=Paenibacillus filicis TaxID=669464 RepID=A0ABU9DML6_9BACL
MVIRNSAKAIIIHENKLLVTKLEDSEGIFYLLPGGGQHAGENLHQTLRRECMEEVGLEVEVGELAYIRECFRDEGIHRVEFMFSCKIDARTHSEIIDSMGTSLDDDQIGIEWIPLEELKSQPLFPVTLRELIVQHEGNEKQRPIYLGEIE